MRRPWGSPPADPTGGGRHRRPGDAPAHGLDVAQDQPERRRPVAPPAPRRRRWRPAGRRGRAGSGPSRTSRAAAPVTTSRAAAATGPAVPVAASSARSATAGAPTDGHAGRRGAVRRGRTAPRPARRRPRRPSSCCAAAALCDDHAPIPVLRRPTRALVLVHVHAAGGGRASAPSPRARTATAGCSTSGRGPAPAAGETPPDLVDLVEASPGTRERVTELVLSVTGDGTGWVRPEEVTFLAPVRTPNALRDFLAFRDHVERGAARRGADVPPAWDRVPVFYKGNRRSVLGPDDPAPWPSYTGKLDYECEVAAVVGARRPRPHAGRGRGGRLRLHGHERLVGPRRAARRDGLLARAGQGQGLRHHARPVGRHPGRVVARRTRTP